MSIFSRCDRWGTGTKGQGPNKGDCSAKGEDCGSCSLCITSVCIRLFRVDHDCSCARVHSATAVFRSYLCMRSASVAFECCPHPSFRKHSVLFSLEARGVPSGLIKDNTTTTEFPIDFATGGGARRGDQTIGYEGDVFGHTNAYLLPKGCPLVRSLGEIVNQQDKPFFHMVAWRVAFRCKEQ